MEELDVGLRIAQLERSLHRTQRVAATSVVALGAFVLFAAQAPQGPQDLVVKKLTANEIEVGTDIKRTRISGGFLAVERTTKKGTENQLHLSLVLPGAIALQGENGNGDFLPDRLALRGGSFAALLSASVEGGEASLALQGPARPGAMDPPPETPEGKTLFGDKPRPRLSETRAKIGFSGERGSFVELRDSMDRARAKLGAQFLTERGAERHMPESTLTLWSEAGDCKTVLPTAK